MSTSDIVWTFIFLVVCPAAGIGIGAMAHSLEARGDASRLETENAHCSRSGGRLVRGQADEFVCIEPKGVIWERKP